MALPEESHSIDSDCLRLILCLTMPFLDLFCSSGGKDVFSSKIIFWAFDLDFLGFVFLTQ